MKALTSALLGSVFLVGCGPPSDTGLSDLGVRSDPLTTVTISEDCDGGGSYEMTATIDQVDDPLKLDVDISYTYTACVWKDYILDGTVSYGKLHEETSPDVFLTEIDYDSSLAYTGDHTGSCTAAFEFRDQSDKPEDKVSVAKSCQHLGTKTMGDLEKKCKLKKPKKDKKGKGKKCELKI